MTNDLPDANVAMNREDVEIDNDEVQSGNLNGDSTVSTVLRRGWCIGKRVAIAGAAIISAPIILPPLLVLSSLGLALSLPFGIYLAGYTCTDKILRTLLPLTPSKEDGKMIESGDSLENGFEENRNTDVSSQRNESLKGPYCVAVMDNVEESKRENELPNLNQERLSVIEVRGEGKSDGTLEEIKPKELMECEGEEVGDDEKGVDMSTCGLAEEKGLPEKCSSEGVSVSLNSDNLDEVSSMEDSGVAKSGVNAGSGLGTRVHSDDERIQDEERLWDQIFAMRTIIGSKTTVQTSLGEELTALYLSVGVEPPLSLKNTSDLSSIINGLRTLKSVVGVE